MPDSPDYFQYRLYSNRHVLGDMAELAVRLGSPVTSDRLGDVVFFNQMDKGVSPFEYVLDGSGADLNIIGNTSEYGGYSLTLTAGSDGPRRVILNHFSNLYEAVKTGWEIHVAFITEYDFLQFSFKRYNGTNYVNPQIYLNQTSGEIQYRDVNDNIVKLADLPNLVYSSPTWIHLKAVMDFSVGEYVRLTMGNITYNMQGLGMPVTTDNSPPVFQPQVLFKGRSGNNDKLLLDLLILTVNEPI